MRKIIFLFILCLCASQSSCSYSGKQDFQSVTVQKFTNIIADTANVVLLDVRTAEEFSAGHIEGATNIDVKRDDFEAISNAQLPKDKTIAVYCRSGRRSKTASERLVTNGFKVVELDSGYNGWVNK